MKKDVVMIKKTFAVMLLATVVGGCVAGIVEEKKEALQVDYIRIYPDGLAEAVVEEKGLKWLHSRKGNIAELHFFNGDQLIPLGRNSESDCRYEHYFFHSMMDADLDTASKWTDLNAQAFKHGTYKNWGYRITPWS